MEGRAPGTERVHLSPSSKVRGVSWWEHVLARWWPSSAKASKSLRVWRGWEPGQHDCNIGDKVKWVRRRLCLERSHITNTLWGHTLSISGCPWIFWNWNGEREMTYFYFTNISRDACSNRLYGCKSRSRDSNWILIIYRFWIPKAQTSYCAVWISLPDNVGHCFYSTTWKPFCLLFA